MTKNIVLVGFMGAGKTVASKAVARRLGVRRISTDDVIIAEENRPITEIFEQEGEQYFRDIETRVIKKCAQEDNVIIDCGGGVVLRRENIDVLKERGIVVYLKASPEVIYERVKHHKHRPLLNVDDPVAKINELLSAREEFYQQADVVVVTDGKNADEMAGDIIDIIKSPGHRVTKSQE